MSLLLGFLLLCLRGEETPTEAEQLQGVWTFTTARKDGKVLKQEEFKDWRIDITPKTIRLEVKGEVKEEATYAVDFEKKPAEIDISHTAGEKKGTKAVGILKLTGDTLLLTFSEPGEARPKNLDAEAGSKRELLVLTRMPSTNKGKLEGTKWANIAGKITIKGVEQDLPGDLIHLDFRPDGTFVFTYPGASRGGEYHLLSGDYMTMRFDEELEGQRDHRQKVVIKEGRLALIDSDGTTLHFRQRSESGSFSPEKT
jgi:uncharacterized protein (TIGR03067 family)